MFTKSFIAAAAAVALSGAAFAGDVYQGGPKAGLRTNTTTFEVNKPFAQDVSAPADKHVYRGGPKDMTPHASR